jgi:hypothetical protein
MGAGRNHTKSRVENPHMATFDRAVQIGPEFFKKAFQDYSNRFWAFAREIMQNSLDCGSRLIQISMEYDPKLDETRVLVANDGEPMTEDILVNKLLSLGSSGKDFQEGAVGGFGKAKEILYFAHQRYVIVSGDHWVEGSGAGYNIVRRDLHHKGTMSNVVWAGDVKSELMEAFQRFMSLCPADLKVKVILDGSEVKGRVKVGQVERVLTSDDEGPWADVRLSKSEAGSYLVRIGGIPMFRGNCDYRGLVVLDLHGTSATRMTSNRDGLKWPYSSQFSDFLTTVAVDRTTAFKLEKAAYKRFAGRKLNVRVPGEPAPVVADEAAGIAVAARSETPTEMGGAGILVRVNGRTEEPPSVLAHEFLVKNCVRRDLPREFDPDSLAWSDHAQWLVRAYAGCLVELHEMFEVTDLFSVGFIHSEGTIAEWEMTPEYGVVYYLNPCLVGRRRSRRRFKRSSRHQILASAAHEFIHGGLNERYHGEDFASKLTEVMALVMLHMRRFNRHIN